MIFNHYSGANWLRRMGTCSTACEGSRDTRTELLTTISEKGGIGVWQS
jgi:hypothetical protein